MKNETNNGMTRRSFMKRSTVAAIAATNLMMFTGLVNAADLEVKYRCSYSSGEVKVYQFKENTVDKCYALQLGDTGKWCVLWGPRDCTTTEQAFGCKDSGGKKITQEFKGSDYCKI